jgi:hypothetical protein
MKNSLLLRKLGFSTGLWWIALRERDLWLERWIETDRVRIKLFFYRTATFIAVAGGFAFLLSRVGESPSLPKLFYLASVFGAITLWMRSGSWVTEYRDIFAGRHDE